MRDEPVDLSVKLSEIPYIKECLSKPTVPILIICLAGSKANSQPIVAHTPPPITPNTRRVARKICESDIRSAIVCGAAHCVLRVTTTSAHINSLHAYVKLALLLAQGEHIDLLFLLPGGLSLIVRTDSVSIISNIKSDVAQLAQNKHIQISVDQFLLKPYGEDAVIKDESTPLYVGPALTLYAYLHTPTDIVNLCNANPNRLQLMPWCCVRSQHPYIVKCKELHQQPKFVLVSKPMPYFTPPVCVGGYPAPTTQCSVSHSYSVSHS
jgi:hypothetical protein